MCKCVYMALATDQYWTSSLVTLHFIEVLGLSHEPEPAYWAGLTSRHTKEIPSPLLPPPGLQADHYVHPHLSGFWGSQLQFRLEWQTLCSAPILFIFTSRVGSWTHAWEADTLPAELHFLCNFLQRGNSHREDRYPLHVQSLWEGGDLLAAGSYQATNCLVKGCLPLLHCHTTTTTTR